MENTKLMRGAAVIDRILKILQGFAVAGVIVPLIFIPLTLILGLKIVADASSVDLGVLTVKLAGDASAYLDVPHIKAAIVCILVCLIIASAAVWYGLRVLREILAPMKEGKPFAPGISRKMRKLALAVLIGGGVYEVCGVLASVFEMKAYHVEKLLNMELITSVTYNYRLNLWFAAVALVLFLLSYIFRCGEELQRESDETL
jgi:hypothetical protein